MLRHLGDDQNFDLGNVEFEIFHRYFDDNTDPAVGCTFLYSSQRRFVMNIYKKNQSHKFIGLDLRGHRITGTCTKEENQGLACCLLSIAELMNFYHLTR